MAADELPRPGVEIIQEFRTVTPQVITPTLIPCIVGVCKQVVEVLETTSAGSQQLNPDALIQLSAEILADAAVGSPAVYSGLDGESLVISINDAPNVTILFSDPGSAGLTPASVVSTVTAAFAAAGVTAAIAELVGDDRFRIRTLARGDNQEILVDASTGATVLTEFGIGAGKSYSGVTSYAQYELKIPQQSFPDPRGNLADLVFEDSTVRGFLASGGGTNLLEFLRTQSFLRNGAVDDAAFITGTANLAAGITAADYQSLTITITVDGGASPESATVAPGFAGTTATALAAELDSQLSGITVDVDDTGLTEYLRFTSDSAGAGSSLSISGGTLVSTAGRVWSSAPTLPVTATGYSIEAIDDGNGDVFTPLLRFEGEDFTAAGTADVVVGTVDLSGLDYTAVTGDLAGKTLILSDGQLPQTVTFATDVADETEVVAAINAIMGVPAGGRITASLQAVTNYLVLTHSRTGDESMISIVGGTGAAALGLTVAVTNGTPGKVFAGDELWIDGTLFGTVVKVAPGGEVDVLKMSVQTTISSDVGSDFHIIAKNLDGVTADRPTPDFTLSLVDGSATLKAQVLRDTVGNALSTVAGRAPVYLAYRAVRQDVTVLADNASLVLSESTTDIEDQLSPISTENPLALGMFLAQANAPGVQITGLGVDAISSDMPFGTVEAFTRAAEGLEAYEVYAIAVLSQEEEVGGIFKTHVEFMSEPEQKGERIVLFNGKMPTTRPNTLVASSASGNSADQTGVNFDTGIASLPALLSAAGISPVGTIPTSAGFFLDIAADSKNYSISGVNGSIVTIRTTFAAGENDDGFYSTTDLNTSPLPSLLINEAFSVNIRGASLTRVDGLPDKQAIAETYQAISRGYGTRRFWNTMPAACATSVQGLEQRVEGFYACAATAGMIAQQTPSQSFTNYPMVAVTRVFGSQDYFSGRQMNIMAAGGTWIWVQDATGAPVISRMALTTDMTSIETRTDSIVKVVDFTAKFLRKSLKNFIGRYNINQGLLDTLGSVVQGVLGFLSESGVLIGGDLNNIIQDADNPDSVLIDVTLDVPYPCNYLRLTLVI